MRYRESLELRPKQAKQSYQRCLRIAKDFVFRRIGLQKRGFGQRIAIPDEWITTGLPSENEYSAERW